MNKAQVAKNLLLAATIIGIVGTGISALANIMPQYAPYIATILSVSAVIVVILEDVAKSLTDELVALKVALKK